MLIKILLIAALCLPGLLQAQDVARADAKAALDAAPVCCTQFGAFDYARLPVHFAEQFIVGRNGPAYEFPSGKSFFIAFELPKYESSYSVSITTRITDRGQGMSIFCPVVLLLDDGYRTVARRRDRDLSTYSGSPPHARRGHPGMSNSIGINEAVRTARYIVFLTDPDSVSRSFGFRGTTGTLPGGGSITTVGSFEVPCNYEGQLDLHINAKYGT